MTNEKTVPDLGQIGKYRLVELIGEGAMGKVYRAFDPVLSRSVAIKLMSQSLGDDPHLRDRFLREARAAANLQHPNIITIYDFGDADGHPYIAMELVEGTDLAHLVEQHENLSLDSKLAIVVGLLRGMGYAHTHGVVHRDIKPANIRITPDARVKIMDFGIAHLQGSEMTHSGAVLGTPDYMAPEQVRGLPVTAQTDIFAAGAVLYEVLTLQKPFTGDSLHSVLYKVVSEEPTPIRKLNPSLPENLERIVETALHKDPRSRYPTAAAMAADLTDARQRLSDLETVDTLRFSRPIKLALPEKEWWERWRGDWERWWRRKEARYAAGGALGLVVLMTVLWAVSGKRQPEPLMAKATPIIVSDTASSAPKPVVAAKTKTPRRGRTPTPTPTPTPSKGPSSPPPATVGLAGLRAEVEEATNRLERAIATAQVSTIKQVIPSLADKAAKDWEDFFRGKVDFKATLHTGDIRVRDTDVEVKGRALFTWHDAKGKLKQSSPEFTATLERTATGWVWKTFNR